MFMRKPLPTLHFSTLCEAESESMDLWPDIIFSCFSHLTLTHTKSVSIMYVVLWIDTSLTCWAGALIVRKLNKSLLCSIGTLVSANTSTAVWTNICFVLAVVLVKRSVKCHCHLTYVLLPSCINASVDDTRNVLDEDNGEEEECVKKTMSKQCRKWRRIEQRS